MLFDKPDGSSSLFFRKDVFAGFQYRVNQTESWVYRHTVPNTVLCFFVKIEYWFKLFSPKNNVINWYLDTICQDGHKYTNNNC